MKPGPKPKASAPFAIAADSKELIDASDEETRARPELSASGKALVEELLRDSADDCEQKLFEDLKTPQTFLTSMQSADNHIYKQPERLPSSKNRGKGLSQSVDTNVYKQNFRKKK